ncbi:type I-C CRISPR-associated protein Cas8c/Csd1 [Bhargavaea beijingensis]|uniref:Type I-C CRISPR-associated protein Cas8c/Csd1 n=1 Tax=Bhargavaea beijingensis TaxID=426756 RepID=A0ABX9ZAY9_9BACL|nr:type I-C CRISPR-associated protein Cas8c/Csd1 [Bhargavaea beijingensis]RSK29650.1 type I-C CRISPR-associated protein Cas8c/Csd1 [Bhargavaea beijingensis]
MSWMKQLAEVYDQNVSRVGEFEERRGQRITLLPVSHVMQSAQIEVLVTSEGEFRRAKVVNKEDARTIVPATTASANRANKSAPHYIHDKLAYVAGDYVAFGGEPKYRQHHNDYLEQMREWAESERAPGKVRAIFAYLAKGKLIRDLVMANILPANAEGKIFDQWKADSGNEKPDIYKVVNSGALSAFIRFDVVHDHPDDPVVWEDLHLFQAFIDYVDSKKTSKTGVCYVTGQNTTLTAQHGSRIRNAGDMSKLISANDKVGFTYRGRFKEPVEAVQIGYEVSQKAHHALRWLIQRQGTYMDSRYFVAFGKKKPEVVDMFASTSDLVRQGVSTGADILAIFNKETSGQVQTEELVAEELNKALQGKTHDLTDDKLDNIVVMALDAATPGRLAIVYYQQLEAALYYEAIRKWHQTCKWIQTYQDPDTKKIITNIGTPSTYRIAGAVYGSKADSRVKKELYTRLLPCIVEGKPLPRDIVRSIYSRVINPFSFQDPMESWAATLNIACALINKQYESEGYTVAVQEENDSRDYLFGRLLGIAEVMERNALKERGENRATNATRYFNAFSQHPARTWMTIRKQLNPYFERASSSVGYYAMLVQKIEDRLKIEQMTNEPLGPVFLLGYSSQVQEMYTKKGEKEHVSTES